MLFIILSLAAEGFNDNLVGRVSVRVDRGVEGSVFTVATQPLPPFRSTLL